MSRIFSLLSAAAILMILTSGLGMYWNMKSDLSKAKQSATDALVKGLALNISGKIELLNQILEKTAENPDIAAAVSSNDSDSINAIAGKIEQTIPKIQKIRLLKPDVTDLDDKSLPKMSLADLDMAREALTADPASAIHGDTNADRHLAIARKISRDGKTIGVILASLKYDFIIKTLQEAQNGNTGYFELKQDKLLLAASGTKGDEASQVSSSARIPNTMWVLQYTAASSEFAGFQILAAIVLLPCILFLIVSLVAYQRLSKMLMNDLSSVMSAFKDIMKNKLQGSYPVNLNEFNVVISSLAQYKRLQNNEGEIPADVAQEDDGLSELLWEDLNLEPRPTPSPAIAAEEPKTGNALQKPSKSEAAAKKPDETAAIFRAYDIRGIAGSTLTRETVYNIGRALGTEARSQDCKTLVVGRDGRTSSQELSESLIQGIVTTGCNVLNIGLAPTPLLYFVAHHIEGRSGVMVTGSHNPARYNGLKMVIKGETLASERIGQLKACIDNQTFVTDKHGTIERNERYANEYIGTLSEDIHIARPMKIVLDCGNGVAGKIGPILFRTLGCEVVELFCEIDGSFPNHHPDPSKPENLTALIKAVKQNQADIGIALDGDGDRLGVVDSNGKIIWPDRQMMLFAKDVLAGKPGSEIIYDVKCSRHLASQITKYGGKPVMCRTGHSFIKARLKETGAKLAGEMSGHIFFNDRWYGFDDALYSAARLIEILSADSRSSAEVFGSLPDSFNTPELNVDMAEGEQHLLVEKLAQTADFSGAKITTIDGLRVDFPDGWGLVRASNTTPSLVFRFEADTEEAMKTIQDRFAQQIRKVTPELTLPF